MGSNEITEYTHGELDELYKAMREGDFPISADRLEATIDELCDKIADFEGKILRGEYCGCDKCDGMPGE